MKTKPRIIIFTGTGKGKTTGALGYVLPYVNQKTIKIVQFLKGSNYAAEQNLGSKLDNLYFYSFGYGCSQSNLIRSGEGHCQSCGKCFRINRQEPGFVYKAWSFTKKIANDNKTDILILDEFAYVLKYKFLDTTSFLTEISTWPAHLIIILTGRVFPQEILDVSVEVYELIEIKHPFRQGIPSRRGIEY